MAHALSNAVYIQGRYEEAEQLTLECEDASRPNDVHSQILWRSMRAKALAQRGELQAAEQLARRQSHSPRQATSTSRTPTR